MSGSPLGIPAHASALVSLQYGDTALKEGQYAGDEIHLRMGGEGVFLRVATRDVLWMSEKGSTFLRGKGFVTWCIHERCGKDCGSRYAEGVGRNGCSYAHISDPDVLAAAKHLLAEKHPSLLSIVEQKSDILTCIPEGRWDPAAQPLSSILTTVLTTSPTQSNPSTTLLSAVLSSFSQVPELDTCPLIIVCDGQHIIESPSDAAAGEGGGGGGGGGGGDPAPDSGMRAKTRLGFKRGCVTRSAAERYEQYKRNIHDIALARSERGFPTEVLELGERQGFGWAVRAAISAKVRTKYTMVVQHDRYFEQPVPIGNIMRLMEGLPEDGEGTGPAGGVHQQPFPVVYLLNSSMRHHLKRVRSRVPNLPEPDSWDSDFFKPKTYRDLTVLPCLAWLDSTHIALTSHLIKFVFGRRGVPAESGVPIRKGDFPEDRLNQAQMKALRDEGFAAHRRYGTWYITADRPHVRHLSGRVFMEEGTSGERARTLLEQLASASGDEDDEDADEDDEQAGGAVGCAP